MKKKTKKKTTAKSKSRKPAKRKPVAKKKPEPEPEIQSVEVERVKCSDCGGYYDRGKPHDMFCPAKTCDECGTTYSDVIEPDGDGRRICEDCREEVEEEPEAV